MGDASEIYIGHRPIYAWPISRYKIMTSHFRNWQTRVHGFKMFINIVTQLNRIVVCVMAKEQYIYILMGTVRTPPLILSNYMPLLKLH